MLLQNLPCHTELPAAGELSPRSFGYAWEEYSGPRTARSNQSQLFQYDRGQNRRSASWCPKYGELSPSPKPAETKPDADSTKDAKRQMPENVSDIFKDASRATASATQTFLTPRARRAAATAAAASHSEGQLKTTEAASPATSGVRLESGSDCKVIANESHGSRDCGNSCKESTRPLASPAAKSAAGFSSPRSQSAPRNMMEYPLEYRRLNGRCVEPVLRSRRPDPPQAAHRSDGIWRDMPVFTQWGALESLQQPGVAHASAAARGKGLAGFTRAGANLPSRRLRSRYIS
eukprot:TRINITY_DN26922_c0_g1_i1.p1 TRINITY_DN26922_c0_g1~~TRINITY_DN26922_c0_g1_i1.p1  ORF type:complete len:290 (+),score=63.09 TRINITY_DN26922_c0_g1_i1:96-965(+)